MQVRLTELGANNFNNKYKINHTNVVAFQPNQLVNMTDGKLWTELPARSIPAFNGYYEQVTRPSPLTGVAVENILAAYSGMPTPRKNKGKPKAAYILKFPHAIAELAKVMTENENKYPNDRFSEYVPEDTVESMTRHLIDLVAPVRVFAPTESKLTAATAILFNALCLVESIVTQQHEWANDD